MFPLVAAAAGLAVCAAVGVFSVLAVRGTGAAMRYLTPEALEFVAINGGFI